MPDQGCLVLARAPSCKPVPSCYLTRFLAGHTPLYMTVFENIYCIALIIMNLDVASTQRW
jgi:hypothetical protein